MIKWKLQMWWGDLKLFLRLSVGEFFLNFISFIRNIIYVILCGLYKVGMICFLISFYYIYECYKEYQAGVGFADMENLKLALGLFFIPVIIAVLKELVSPE